MPLFRSLLHTALAVLFLVGAAAAQDFANEPHRPQIHFTPVKNWMNDPNGMVYHNGTWYLFYQYHPGSTTWGPMHWGHATSTNLVHWKHQPVALYPDSLGYIFSGSAVVDHNNSSGLGENGQAPLVAIYTYHDTAGEKRGRKDFETQGIAYSNDNGATWTKYKGNPVLRNPGIVDFRDPKVMWYAPQQKWIMTLATKDRISFYAAPDLKNWKKESEFGASLGAHGGVWECPDLFPLEYKGRQIWVLLVNLNPGGPNGGSATQYFLGDFDGKTFTPMYPGTRWLDYGPDEYAGITWSNTGKRKVFIGWMSNWKYANVVPTTNWRSATTLPRDLGLKEVNGVLYVTSKPSAELAVLQEKAATYTNVPAASGWQLPSSGKRALLPCRIDLSSEKGGSFALSFANDLGEELVVGYDQEANQYYVDRSRAGKKDFHKEFAARHTAPRLANVGSTNLTLYVDVASVELFADDGLSVMTSIFFPNKPFDKVRLNGTGTFDKVRYTPLRSIWK